VPPRYAERTLLLGPSMIWLLPAAFLGLFSALQINDPDALPWIVAYALPAALCLARARGGGSPLLSGFLFLVYACLSFHLWPQEAGLLGAMSPERPGIEKTRESLGLALCALCLLVQAIPIARGPPPSL
jgi:hypothetical protein